MGIVKDWIRSYRKSARLRKLQLAYCPPNDTAEDLTKSLFDNTRKLALAQFLELCEEDPNVSEVMTLYSISKKELEEIHWELMKEGAGIWVKGHYVPLSSLAYVEPLMYILEAKAQKRELRKICYDICEYWKNRAVLRHMIDVKSVNPSKSKIG